ncbi:helix-turn-helix domain-containing protein [Pseudonocardia kujensis]|uniref:PucR family transcriptional regulator n=1 Tax=Pseudonocardia kujensis TaxID=1128675 RepID=UPI001E4C6097|nr:helix-turn-helix domain-containing protein [Pseudonocardia kujensis]MCE0765092.1 helix-turn-helix domain-containing protein [Pseudonocardia kujensis]
MLADADGADVLTMVAAVARDIDARLPGLTVEMTDWFAEVIPEFRHDETVRRLMVASTSANLTEIVDMLAHSIPLEQIAVPAAAAEYARRFAQHELSLEALLRAYRLGEQMFGQWALASLRRLGLHDSPCVLDAVAELSSRTNRYIDQVIEALIDIYETERRRWTTRTGAGQATRVRMVLETEQLTDEAASELLGIPMTAWHRAAVVWTPAPADATFDDTVLQVGARVLQEASGRSPLAVLADSRTLWVWLSAAEPPPLDLDLLRARTPARLRIALGAPSRGLDGFRGSLAEARRARTVAETAEDRPVVTDFDDVAVAALLTDHSGDLRHWVDRVLPGLTGDDPGIRQLRETLQVFLECNGSYTQAAARLHLHKNTVHYRVRKAEDLRGRPVGADRLAVEVALRAAAQLRGRL